MTAPDLIYAVVGFLKGDDVRGEFASSPEAFSPHPRPVAYIRRDPAALAADELVQAMIGAAVEEAKAIIADFPTPRSEDVMHGHEDAYRALEVFHPDATAALAARDKRIRSAALEEAAKVCDAEAAAYEAEADQAFCGPIAVRLRGRAAAICALKEAP